MKATSEAEFQKRVIELAQLRKWLVAHCRKVRVQRANGSVYWETPMAADGRGFPDLVMIRDGVLLVAELKVGKNSTTPEQDRWLERFSRAGALTHVWYPKHWKQIKEALE